MTEKKKNREREDKFGDLAVITSKLWRYLCQLRVPEDAGKDEIKHLKDERNHHGEEGHPHQDAQQAHPSDKQQEPWRRQTTGGWLRPTVREQGQTGGAAAPTLKEKKPGRRNDEGHDGKGEEERNRQHGEGSEPQQRVSEGRVAEEVLARPAAQQLRYLLMRQKSGFFCIFVQHVVKNIHPCRVSFECEACTSSSLR